MVITRVAAALLGSAVLALDPAKAALIEVTGGSLTATASSGQSSTPESNETTPLSASSNVFSASASVYKDINPSFLAYNVAGAEVHLDGTAGQLAISASARGISYPTGVGSASATGSIDFTLTAPTTMQLDWHSSWTGLGWSGGSVLLSVGSATLLYCGMAQNGCSSTITGPFLNALFLGAGTYHLDATTDARPSNTDAFNSFQFGMTPVPLPLGAWLFLSGLGWLVGVLKRK